MAQLEPGTSKRPDYLPEGWYERHGLYYPIPLNDDGWVNEHPDFLDGWEAAVQGNNPRQSDWDNLGLTATRYWEGYQKGLYWAAANGIVDSFRATEMFSLIPPAKPAPARKFESPSPTTERADVIELGPNSSVLIPGNKSETWQLGFRDAVLNGVKTTTYGNLTGLSGSISEYNEGFHSGLEWMVAEGRMTASVARTLMGLPDVGDLEDTQPKVDMVTRPPHYTFGKYEVIDVLYDWQLEYPLDNVVKYAARAGKKGDEAQQLQDLEKIRYYVNFLIVQKGGEDWKPEK